MRTAAVEMKYEEVVQQTEAAEAAQAALHTKLDTVLTNLKKQLVAGCFEAAVEEAAVVCAEALEEQAVGRGTLILVQNCLVIGSNVYVGLEYGPKEETRSSSNCW